MNTRQSPVDMLIEAMAVGTDAMIRRQEAQGQRDLVSSAMLPKECIACTREQIAAMGVVFGEDSDDLFVNVTLPVGWKLQPTEHAMWSDLLDQQGRTRANIFYKAAFYDRSAHINLCRCVTPSRRWHEESNETSAIVLCAGATVFETRRVARDDYPACDAIEAEARVWADEHYPNWRDVLAYW